MFFFSYNILSAFLYQWPHRMSWEIFLLFLFWQVWWKPLLNDYLTIWSWDFPYRKLCAMDCFNDLTPNLFTCYRYSDFIFSIINFGSLCLSDFFPISSTLSNLLNCLLHNIWTLSYVILTFLQGQYSCSFSHFQFY